MITLSQALLEMVNKMPVMEEYLTSGLLNYSAVARHIKPEIDKRLFKDVSEVSIMMALKRLSPQLSKNLPSLDMTSYIQDITVRSNLVELTYLNSPILPEGIRNLYDRASADKEYCTHSQGVTEATIIVSKSFEENTKEIFKSEKLLSTIDGLSAVILRLNDQTVTTPGSYYTILKSLTLAGVNLFEMISTTHELTLIFKDEDIQRAFEVLRNTK